MINKLWKWESGHVPLTVNRFFSFKTHHIKMNRQTDILKVSWFRNVYFGVFNFSPKNERKQVNLRYHSSKVEFFSFVFWENWGYQKVLLKLTDLYHTIHWQVYVYEVSCPLIWAHTWHDLDSCCCNLKSNFLHQWFYGKHKSCHKHVEFMSVLLPNLFHWLQNW